ncbi:PREDICTED: F-box protein ETP1-like [Camelina sativa]|uniref:F-box protein ETP1-like n=1 Tax=Camelina sativa TaxID=90675 RepID=A0ABM0W5Z8_CAMSA|nr:PREDICTED: F-box protein ETP1-like [Camelina sativa]XP_010466169.1 PREDICTED: F-box protein ETP1-like [Camelina sativa]
MAIPDLPKDLVEDEILCRVPATSLKRLRSTCKRWNRLFKDDRRFASEHCEKAAKEFLFLILTEKMRICTVSKINLPQHGDDALPPPSPSVEVGRELSLPDPYYNNSEQFDIDEAFPCDGLLLCTHDGHPGRGSQIVVWNPLNGQTRWIETGNRCRRGGLFVLGYCCIGKRRRRRRRRSYKVLSWGYSFKNAEIYELNSDVVDSWRRIPDDDLDPPGWCIRIHNDSSVSFKGNTYFFACEESKPHLGWSLFRFDFSTEKSSLFVPLSSQCPLPEVMRLSVAVGGEKLSVLLQPDCTSKAEIWVTSKIDDSTTTKAVSWNKVLALDLSRDLQINDLVRFVFDEDKKVAVCCQKWVHADGIHCNDKVYFLGEDNKVSEFGFGLKVDDLGMSDIWPVIHNYVPSLVHIELPVGGKRKRGSS